MIFMTNLQSRGPKWRNSNAIERRVSSAMQSLAMSRRKAESFRYSAIRH